MRVTLSAINAALQSEGIPGQLVKGTGYFYMQDRPEEPGFWSRASEQSFYTFHLGGQSVEAWVSEIRDLYEREREWMGESLKHEQQRVKILCSGCRLGDVERVLREMGYPSTGLTVKDNDVVIEVPVRKYIDVLHDLLGYGLDAVTLDPTMTYDALDREIDLLTEGIVSVKDFLQATIHEKFTVAADRLAQAGEISRDERIELSGLIGDVLKDFDSDFPEEIAERQINVELELEEESLKHEEIDVGDRVRHRMSGETGEVVAVEMPGFRVDVKWDSGAEPRYRSGGEVTTVNTSNLELESLKHEQGSVVEIILKGISAASAWLLLQSHGIRSESAAGNSLLVFPGDLDRIKSLLSFSGASYEIAEGFDRAIELLVDGQEFDEVVSLLTVPLAGTGLENLPGQVGGLFKKGGAAIKAADVKLKSLAKGVAKGAKKGAEFIKSCPKGKERNPTTGECEAIECPEGYFLDKESGECRMRSIERHECPEGKVWDPDRRICVVPIDPKTKKPVTCGEDEEWEPLAKACLPKVGKKTRGKIKSGELPEKLPPAKEPKEVEPAKEPKLLPAPKEPEAAKPEPEKKVAEPGAVPQPGQRCPRGYHKNRKTGVCEPREAKAASMFRDRGWQEWSLRKPRFEQSAFVTLVVSDPGMAVVLLDQAGISNVSTNGSVMVRRGDVDWALHQFQDAGIEVLDIEARRRLEQDEAKPELDIDAIAKKLGVKPDQLAQGIEVEKEHSDTVDGDIRAIIAIAVDHLAEDPEYYTKLAAIHEEPGEEEEPEEEPEEVTEEAEQAITAFLSQNPSPSDDEIHALAEKLDMDPDELEEIVYAMLGQELAEEGFRHEQFMDTIHAESDARYYARNGLSASWIRDALLRDYPGLSPAEAERIAAEAVRTSWN